VSLTYLGFVADHRNSSITRTFGLVFASLFSFSAAPLPFLSIFGALPFNVFEGRVVRDVESVVGLHCFE